MEVALTFLGWLLLVGVVVVILGVISKPPSSIDYFDQDLK